MYRVYFLEEEFETKSDAEEAIFNWVEDNQDDIIDEDYPGGIEIYGMNYSASMILKECDPIAYRCMTSDIADSYYCEIEEENYKND